MHELFYRDGKITMQDFHHSFSKITPSLRRHPLTITQAKGNKLSWDDIGGLESVKLSLTQMVEWPLKHIVKRNHKSKCLVIIICRMFLTV